MKHVFLLMFISILFDACSPATKSAGKDISNKSANVQRADSILSTKQQSGIDYLAKGTNPVAWTLEMDFDKRFLFSPSDGTPISVQASNPIKLMDVAAESYRSQDPAKPLNIILYTNLFCPGEQSRKVDVIVQGKKYSGCGSYLNNNGLQGKWQLEYIYSEKQDAANYPKGLPMLEFDLKKKSLSGHDGCNTVLSQVECQGNRIKFAAFASTLMSCTNQKAEKIFTNMLSNNVVEYAIKNDQLTIYLIDDGRLLFKKAD
jgi:heat shock protein HslJ